MLGFNKYVIPFQREEQKLPFNIAGLDTVKYNNQNFFEKAGDAIDQAIKESSQEDIPPDSSDQTLQLFFMERDLLLSPLDNDGDKGLYNLGMPLGFDLLVSFSGNEYVYFGKFASLRAESIIWRIRKLDALMSGRRSSIPLRLQQGVVTPEQMPAIEHIFKTLRVLIIVSSDVDKQNILSAIAIDQLNFSAEVLTVSEGVEEVRQAIP